jgi:TonB family protein
MITFINYLIEVNLGLVFFYAIYWLLLQNENQFGFKRIYLLGSLCASLLFPAFTIESQSLVLIPSLGESVPAHWLSEITVYGDGQTAPEKVIATASYWTWLTYTYLTIAAIILVIFIFRLVEITRLYITARRYAWKNYTVAESANVKGVFSFFQFIFLSPAENLDDQEKLEILRHEEVHIQKLHSFDILLINIIGIVCWFNPVIKSYKKSLVQIHEFEADARSVEGRDVNEYCGLLAKVALQSHGYVLANHFTNSFTLKRINMMKTVRKKIKQWKVVTVSVTALLIFFVVACQDQVMQDIQTIADNSSAAIVLPAQVEAELLKLKQANPKAEYIVMEMNDEGKKKMEELDKDPEFKNNLIGVHIIKTTDQSFAILQKGDRTNALATMTASDNEVFSIVEESASPMGGFPLLYEYIGTNIQYPQEARSKGIEGKVFIEFVVNVDGTLSDFVPIKGLGAGCDQEAIRVLQTANIAWIPGKQQGKSVKQKMVLPIIFKLGSGNPAAVIIGEADNNYPGSQYEFKITITKTVVNGLAQISGQVKNQDGAPLAGTNILVKSTTTGTVSDLEGSFKIDTQQNTGTLVFSFIGFKTMEAEF